MKPKTLSDNANRTKGCARTIKDKPLPRDIDGFNLLGCMGIGIIRMDRGLRIHYVNGEAARLLGKPKEELIGELFADSIPGAVRGEILQEFDLALTEKSGSNIERFFPDPINLWLNCRLNAYQGGLVLIIQDITENKRTEKAQNKNETRFRELADAMPQLVWTAEPDGSVDYYNVRYKDYRGISKTQDGIFEWGLVLHEEDLRPTEAAWRHSVETGDIYQIEHRVQLVDGNYYWHLSRGLPVRDESGRIVKWFGTATNIEIVKQAEEKTRMLNIELDRKVRDRTNALARTVGQLEEQKEILQTVIDHIPVMLTFYDSQGRMKLVNREFERLVGWSLAEVTDKDLMTAVYPDPEYRRRGREYMMDAEPGWNDFEVTTRSGEILQSSWANIRLSDGSLIGIGIDITERKRMEQDLLRLAAAIEQAGEGIALFSTEGVFEYFNSAYEKMYGYKKAEFIGKKIEELGEEIHEMYQKIWNKIRTDGEVWTGRTTRRKENGDTLEVDMTISPVYDREGRIMNFVSVSRDVTDEVRLQQQIIQSQKMDAIGALAGGVAHDLKNILTPILINTEIALEEMGKNHPLHPVLGEVLHAARLGKDLVAQILTFSRRSPQKKVPVNIASLVHETAALLKSSFPPSIEIRENIDDDCAIVEADPTRIKQVLINLGSNAGYAMRQLGGVLEFDLRCMDLDEESCGQIAPDLAPDSYLELTVRDTGTGIDEQTLEHIFEPFFTTKPKEEGTGMGLAVTHGIIKEHQGDITVQSTPGKGSVFTVYLPRPAEPKSGHARQTERCA